MYRLASFFFLLFVSLTAAAQSGETFFNKRLASLDRADAAKLQGKGGVLIQSPHNDLIIDLSTKAKTPFTVQGPVSAGAGVYEYYVLADISKQKEVYVICSRKGDPQKTEFKKNLVKDKFLGYRVEAVENPIRFEDISARGEVYADASGAMIEFRTPLTGVSVECPKGLKCTVSRDKLDSDASINVIRVVIPVKDLTAARTDWEQKQAAYDQLNEKCSAADYTPTEAEFQQLDQLKEAAAAAEDAFEALSTVTVSADGTNTLAFDISDFGPRVKRVYSVVPTTTKEFGSEYQNLLNQGMTAFKSRKYATAEDFYKKAAAAKGISDSEKTSAEEMAGQMATYKELMKRVQTVVSMLNDSIKHQKQTGQSARYSFLSNAYKTAISNMKQLHDATGDEWFKKYIDKYSRQLDDLKIVIEGKVTYVDSKKYTEEPAANCRVYASSSQSYGASAPETVCDAQGNFHIELKPDTYRFLIFEGGKPGKPMRNVQTIHGDCHQTLNVRIGK